MSLHVAPDDLRALARSLMRDAGVDAAQIATVVDNLVWNDMAGRRNHGVERLPILLRRVRAGLIRCPAETIETRLGPGLARLDAGGGFGQHAGRLAMDRAVALAGETGLGAVGVRDSNFFGTGAYFVQIAAAAGMIGLALSNSFPKVAAQGGLRPVLGTNPLAFAAPRRDGRALLVDMSTAGLAGSTIRAHQRAGAALPEGLVIDAGGRPVTDPDAAGEGTLLPAAGAKGFGLALMVEVLAGVLTGAGIGAGVGSLYRDFDRNGDSGHFLLALDPRRFMPEAAWFDRMDTLEALLRASGDGVRLPGELRWQALEESAARGIPLEPATRAALERLARAGGIGVPWD